VNKAPALEFRFDLNNPKFKIYPFTFLRASGRITIAGDTAPYLVSGDLVAQEALIQENFNKGGGKASRSSAFMPGPGGADGDTEFHLFNLNIDARADRGILVKNDLFDLESKGHARIYGPMETPRIQGRAEVLQGKILFNETVFNVQNAVVEFKNPVVIDPDFDLTAITDYKGYKVNLYASGNASSPRISFKSQPPLSQEDIVSLLTLGMTSSGYKSLRNQDRDAYSRDEVYSLLFNQSGINRGLKSKFGVNVGVDQAVNTVNQQSAFRSSADVSGNVAPKVVLQKEIVKNLNAKVGSTLGVGDSRQQDLNLEYQFGRNASVTGVYEDQRGTTARNSRTSMGVDLKFRWSFR
jgi:translocation and assembly module TamB